MQVKSLSVLSLDELKKYIEDISQTAFTPTLAIAFVSPNYNLDPCIDYLMSQKIEVLGCTSSGEILNDGIVSNSMTILFFDISKSHYQAIVTDLTHSQSSNAPNTNRIEFSKPNAVFFTSGAGYDGEATLNMVKSLLPDTAKLFGAMAGDNLNKSEQYVFHNRTKLRFGYVCLAIDGHYIDIYGNSFSGWNSLGRTLQITKSTSNIIYEVDNQPVIEVYQKYFGELETMPSEKVDDVSNYIGMYPIQVQRENDTIMRSPLSIDRKNKSLILSGSVREGDHFKFCPTPSFEVLQKTVDNFELYAKEVEEPEAIIMVNCKGRHTLFGPLYNEEINNLYNIWAKPLIGIMSDGEYGMSSTQQSCHLHNVTCTMILFRSIK